MKGVPVVENLNKLFKIVLKYKLLHVAYWSYAVIALTHVVQSRHGGSWGLNFGYAFIDIVFQMVCVYTVLYFLLPNYLTRQKYFRFVIFLLLCFLACSFLTAVAEGLYSLIALNKDIRAGRIFFRTLTSAPDMILVTAVFSAIIIIQSKYVNDQRNKKLERELLEAQLNFLKEQINPHFIFNVINSIYVLIDEDKKLASETLLKFSGLLRYQLYECRNASMPIERELNFLRDYIGLETIRNRENLQVVVDLSTNINHFEISPFILTPFVENAFKHVSHWSHAENYIKIAAGKTDHEFHFSVTNTTETPVSENNTGYKGIGLENVKKRLNLIYPQRHTLNIIQQHNTYTVTLTLHVNSNELHRGGR